MNKAKLLGGIGVALVAMSASGVVAFADSTSPTSTGRAAYATQIKAEIQQIKSLQAERKTLNEQLKSAFQGLKGEHLRKTNPTAYQAIHATHEQILRDRATLLNDDANIDADRTSENWAQLVTDLQTKATDLQTLIDQKQQQLKNVQAATRTVQQ